MFIFCRILSTLRLQSRDRGKKSKPKRYSRGDGSKAEGIFERQTKPKTQEICPEPSKRLENYCDTTTAYVKVEEMNVQGHLFHAL